MIAFIDMRNLFDSFELHFERTEVKNLISYRLFLWFHISVFLIQYSGPLKQNKDNFSFVLIARNPSTGIQVIEIEPSYRKCTWSLTLTLTPL